MRSNRGSIRNRFRRKKLNEGFELQLTSLMDALVIILIFLLKNFSASSVQFSTVNGIQLPNSVGRDIPPQSLQVIVTPEGMTFENERIVDFVQTAQTLEDGSSGYKLKKTDLDEGGARIIPLYDALMKAKEKSELLRSKSMARDEKGQPLPFEGILAIQADKRIEYDTLRKIMYTSGAAGYRVFRFLAQSKDGG
ncbi:MAG: biopolymer transporter ExbD [Bdellovibrionales bacterium]|nr:biopolymer transporter ExbD [Bdellovibrionales bacterium]